MSCNTVGYAFVGLSLMILAGCSSSTSSDKSDVGGDGGKAADAATALGSISCYTSAMQLCEEDSNPTAEIRDNLMVSCSSTSGEFKDTAACPMAAFIGKCTFVEGKNTRTRRYYMGPGVDAAYQQDFCVNTAHGAWSTTF